MIGCAARGRRCHNLILAICPVLLRPCATITLPRFLLSQIDAAEVTPMGTPADNVAKLKDAYRLWHETKGGSVKIWLDMAADDVKVRSLAAGAPAAPFTSEINSKEQFRRYFDGLLAEWQMINYRTVHFIAEGERVAVLASTAWRNLKTGREIDTPKADFWTFRDGKVVEFHEFYDTAGLAAAAQA
jgi:uncharacterized protein